MADGSSSEVAAPREVDVAGRMREVREAVSSGRLALPPVPSPLPDGITRASDGVLGQRDAVSGEYPSFAERRRGISRAELSALRKRTREVARGVTFKEFDFPSTVPIAGPVFSLFRRAWNGVSTRWYVKYALAQQTQFNSATANVLNDLTRLLSVQQDMIEKLQMEVEDLRAELEAARTPRAPLGQDMAESEGATGGRPGPHLGAQ
ncbi:MAG: hypothetical protein M0Z94_12785 [Dehalococcoidales bacterium]|nr:hypothetical protein [Dehalococcoidales bacterium]